MRILERLSKLRESRRPRAIAVSVAQSRYVQAQDVRASVHEDGAVILHVERGSLFRINRTGLAILEELQAGHPPAAIAQRLGQRFGVEQEIVSRDTEQFVEDLVSQAILVRESA
jgi:hypothetical protein